MNYRNDPQRRKDADFEALMNSIGAEDIPETDGEYFASIEAQYGRALDLKDVEIIHLQDSRRRWRIACIALGVALTAAICIAVSSTTQRAADYPPPAAAHSFDYEPVVPSRTDRRVIRLGE